MIKWILIITFNKTKKGKYNKKCNPLLLITNKNTKILAS